MLDIARLEHLKTVLERVRDEHRSFDMGRWSSTFGVTDPDNSHCGTTGCVLGWACHDPEFQAQGLRLVPGKLQRPEPFYIDPKGWARMDYEAGEKFFGLNVEQGRFLFHPSARDFVANHDVRAAIRRVHYLLALHYNRYGRPAAVPAEPMVEPAPARELEPA